MLRALRALRALLARDEAAHACREADTGLGDLVRERRGGAEVAEQQMLADVHEARVRAMHAHREEVAQPAATAVARPAGRRRRARRRLGGWQRRSGEHLQPLHALEEEAAPAEQPAAVEQLAKQLQCPRAARLATALGTAADVRGGAALGGEVQVVDEQQQRLGGRRAEQILARRLERAFDDALHRLSAAAAPRMDAHRRAEEALPRLVLLVLAPVQRVQQLQALPHATLRSVQVDGRAEAEGENKGVLRMRWWWQGWHKHRHRWRCSPRR